MARSVRIKVDADSAIRRMRKMAERSLDFKIVFQWAKRELQRANSLNFKSGGLPVGEWDALSPQYAAWKSVNFPGKPIMQRTGRLMDSLVRLDGPVNRIGRLTAQFGTEVEYAKFHQYGTTKMPKRQIVYEPPLFARNLATHVGRYVVEGELAKELKAFHP